MCFYWLLKHLNDYNLKECIYLIFVIFSSRFVRGDLLTFQKKPCVFEQDTKLSQDITSSICDLPFTFAAKLMVMIL